MSTPLPALRVDDEQVKTARRLAARAIETARSHYPELAPWQRLAKARDALAENSTEFLLMGEVNLARRNACAFELVRNRVTRIINDLNQGTSA